MKDNQYALLFILIFMSSNAWTQLRSDLKCIGKKSKKIESLSVQIIDYSFAKEMTVKFGDKNCYYKINNIHDGRRSVVEYIEFELIKDEKKCSGKNSKYFLDKGFMKLVKRKKVFENYILIVKGQDSLSCELKEFKKKSFIKD